ncbi:30S ribosomal protein S1 [Myxococcota bacterium]|nr:30S ribosomal protein S1 [Myxococcota bacterium]MBU1431074.1 30S ribosomal protein S1 [Myxococcota bacterium]MBU1896518.1 30S ribosomal protein S1 [Myxococcota bacterium]
MEYRNVNVKELRNRTEIPQESAQSALASGQESFADLFEQFESSQSFRVGEIVEGRVLSINKDYVVVDIGYKSEGRIPVNEFKDSEGNVDINEGDLVEVYVDQAEEDDAIVELSKEKAVRLRIWEQISLACERDELVTGRITARVKGGLSVDIGVKAFLPGSQVDIRPIRNLEKFINQEFEFKVIKFNKRRGNIVLSRRVLLEKERASLKAKTLQQLEEGRVLKGTVKNITEYGAFVDLGGIDGLLHITDMSWGRVNHPSEMVQVGDEIEVKILKFNAETERVSLGLKQISEDPWIHAEEKYHVGDRVEGKVVSLTDYGAFVELEEGIEGLIHISEMSWTRRVKHPSRMVAIGDIVETIVLDIDSKNKRISLGMKQIEPNPWTLLHERYPVGTRILGKIRNITDFGIFIGIEEGIDGLVHISDLSWTQKIRHPSELFKKGDEVEAVVLNIDVENERFSLGIKQLTPDAWEEEIPNKYTIGRVVQGKITKIHDFGAFMELEPGIEGLIHVSEMSTERVNNPLEIVSEGQEVLAEIISMDREERKIGLSLKSVGAGEDPDVRSYLEKQGKSTASFGDVFGHQLGMNDEEDDEV